MLKIFETFLHVYRGLSGGVGCEVPRNFGPLLKDIFFTGLGDIPCRVFSCVSLLNQTRLPSETKNKLFIFNVFVIVLKQF